MKQKYNEIDWHEFLNSFLDLTELACKEIENPKHIENIGGQEIKYNDVRLKIAIIYNMKHAIEIFIKALIRIADNSSKEKIDGHEGHDLNKLLELLEKRMENGAIKKVIKNLNDNQDELASFTQQEIEEFKKYAKEIKTISDYYFKLKFLNKEDIVIIDTKNTAFKYPENITQINAQINYFDFIYGSKLDIEKIKEDIRFLKMYFDSIKTVFYLYHLHKSN